jgi:polyisoprenoid-binding protein YceI
MMISNVKGQFTTVTGVMTLDEADVTNSRVEATVEAGSINTRDSQRDAHLKSGDFLDVEKFPAIAFVSKKVAGAGDEWKVTGDLTIHGVTKEVTLDVEGLAPEAKDPWGNVKSGATAVTKISRKEFGMVFNVALETGGVMVADEVAITLELELLRG